MSTHRALVWCSAITSFVVSCGQIFTLLSFRFFSNLVGKDLSDQVENAQANFCCRSENNLLDKHGMDSSFVFNRGRRRGGSLWWTIRGGFAWKGYLLQALGISKGRDFTSSSIEKGREICHLGLWKGRKGLTGEFYGLIKSRKRSIFVIDSYLKTVHLQQLKGMQSSKQGMWKGYHLSIEVIRKGYLFREKWYKKRVRGWTWGRSLPV